MPNVHAPNANAEEWWKTAVVYQVYPRSFADASTSANPVPGVGNLAGLIEHLDHLQWLGVDALWLSPVFTSPMADFGYDVSDYCDIDPVFGSLADMDRLISEAHARDLKVLLDWVPNHTSDQHPWFLESRQDRTNPKADWYVWRDQPENNWLASFPAGESAWHFDDVRGQYYLRCFLSQQPDLDWDHPDVEAAMHETLRFWLDRGVDGFRMDVVHLIGKDLSIDDPPSAVARGFGHVPFNDQPVTHERLRAIRRILDSYPGDRTSVGEVYLLDEERMAEYYGHGDELQLSFNFRFVWAPFVAEELTSRIARTLEVLAARGAWPTWVLSNHDVPRHRQRYGGDEAAARVAAVMLLTLPGTPFVYQGEELGLLDADVPPDRVVDPGGRDGCRAPIPWTAEPLHGWHADPWLPFAPEVDRRNVATLREDEHSILHLYRRLLAFRRSAGPLHALDFELIPLGDDVVAYRRGDLVVIANLGDTTVPLPHDHAVLLASDDALDGTVIRNLSPLVAVVAQRA